VGEYLEEDLKKKVFAKFGLPTVQEKNLGSKRKSENDCISSEEGHKKKIKVSDGENVVEPLEDYGSSKNSSSNSSTAVSFSPNFFPEYVCLPGLVKLVHS